MHQRLAISLVSLFALCRVASAADLAPVAISAEDFSKRWNVAVGAYVWAASLDATVGIDPLQPANVHASFGDILTNLDFAFMAVAEARYERFGVFSDLIYTKLSADASGPAGFVNVSSTNELFVGTLMGQYRALESGNSSVDVMAGARLWALSADLELTTPRRVRSRSGEEVWVDPMIGVKGHLQGDTPFYVSGWGMLGGLGVGADVDWDVLAGAGYDISDRFSLFAGYRALGVDYDSEGFEFDAVQHGPIVSGIVRF